MNYEKVPKYNQCLDIVKNCKAFSHSTQVLNGHKVESFKYNINLPGMWDGEHNINMRGITFVDEQLVALPFPKFFNVGENELVQRMDIKDAIYAVEKVDGSLISFFEIDGEIELKTMKSIESDVANEAREYFKTRPDIKEFVKTLLEGHLSPMFEFVSKKSKIVIDYGETDLIFLGARSLDKYTIFKHTDFKDVPETITMPKTIEIDGIEEYLEKEDVEGLVLYFENGYMLKAKTDRYCTIHKLLDNFVPKNLVQSIIDNSLDDVISLLFMHSLHDQIKEAKNIEIKYQARFNEMDSIVDAYYNSVKNLETRKEQAEWLKENASGPYMPMVFKKLDGFDYSDVKNKIILNESKNW